MITTEAELKELIQQARVAQDHAYAPYSDFRVGAVLVGASHQRYEGCNVENLSYGLTICAERNALFRAVADGERRFLKLVIVGDSRQPLAPCGACRQVLAEFEPDLEIFMVGGDGTVEQARLGELLPKSKQGILDRDCREKREG